LEDTITVLERVREHAAWFRLNDQLDWYSKESSKKQRCRLVTAVLGAGVAMLEGVQQLGQYHDLWISYRSTAENLKHEKYLFLAGSGPYRDLQTEDALRLLAERVEEQVSTEHAKWVSEAEQAGQQKQS
jgi:hypothetical protein